MIVILYDKPCECCGNKVEYPNRKLCIYCSASQHHKNNRPKHCEGKFDRNRRPFQNVSSGLPQAGGDPSLPAAESSLVTCGRETAII